MYVFVNHGEFGTVLFDIPINGVIPLSTMLDCQFIPFNCYMIF